MRSAGSPSSAASAGSASRATCRRRVTGASEYFPDGLVFQGVTIGGVVQNFTVRKSFPEVRNNPLWHNLAPRSAAPTICSGNGKTVIKASWGKYLDQINTGTPPNPNANINQTYVWNDLNGDLIFQRGNAMWNGLRYVGGEFGAQNTTAPRGRAVRPSAAPSIPRRIHAGLDHELFPNFRLDISYLHSRERTSQGTLDNAMELWPSLYTPSPG